MKMMSLSFLVLSVIAPPAFADQKAAEVEKTRFLKLPVGTSIAAVSPDGKTVVLRETDAGKAPLYDRQTMKKIFSIPVIRAEEGNPTLRGLAAAAFSPDGKSLALLTLFAELRIHNVKTGNRTATITFPKEVEAVFGIGITRILFSPDGKQFALIMPEIGLAKLGGGLGFCALFEIKTGKHLHTLGGVRGAVVTKSGKFLALRTDNKEKNPQIIDLKTRKTIRQLNKGREFSVMNVRFSRDGRLVFAGGPKRMAVWNVQTGKQMMSFRGSDKELFDYGAAFSADGKILIAGSLHSANPVTGIIRLFRLSDGKILWEKSRFRIVPHVIGTTPDGKAAMYQFGEPARLTIRQFAERKVRN